MQRAPHDLGEMVSCGVAAQVFSPRSSGGDLSFHKAYHAEQRMEESATWVTHIRPSCQYFCMVQAISTCT